MKKVNIIRYLEEIGEGEYGLYIKRGDYISDMINEAASGYVYYSGDDDFYYIDMAVEAYGYDILEEGVLYAAQIGYEVEMNEKYWDYIEECTKNLEFKDLEEDIKEEIIKDIAENDMELKIIESVKNNNYDKYLKIIKKYTYANIYE
jgi:hypothetical protein